MTSYFSFSIFDLQHYYNNPNPECPRGWKPPNQVQVSNLSFIDIDGKLADIQGNEVFHFAGLPDSPFQNLHVENVYFERPPQSVSWNCSHLVHSTVKNASVTPWPPCPQFRITDSDARLTFRDPPNPCTVCMVVLAVLAFHVTWHRLVAGPVVGRPMVGGRVRHRMLSMFQKEASISLR